MTLDSVCPAPPGKMLLVVKSPSTTLSGPFTIAPPGPPPLPSPDNGVWLRILDEVFGRGNDEEEELDVDVEESWV